MRRIVILDGATLVDSDADWDELRAMAGEVAIYGRTPDDCVVERCAGAEMVLITKASLGASELDQLPELRYIGVIATGYDSVDVEAASRRGVVVTNIPSYGTESVAQFVFALLLELTSRVGQHDAAVRAGCWSAHPDWSMRMVPLVELAGKTMGIVGYGRIGSRVAQIAEAFGMSVLVDDPQAGASVRKAPLATLLAESDVVSLHCPLTVETRGLIDRERLALMKRTAFLINTARGPLVVAEDLAGALRDHRIAGAALDVLSPEPPPADHPLFSVENCILTPHIAWATREARSRLMHITFENVRAYLAGKPVNTVGPAILR